MFSDSDLLPNTLWETNSNQHHVPSPLESRLCILSRLRSSSLIHALSEFLFSHLKDSVLVNNFSAIAAFLSKDWEISKEEFMV